MTALEFCTPSCKTVLEKYMWSRRLEHYHLRLDAQKKIKNMRLDEQSNFEEKIVGE